MNILAIETSCDETAAAVVQDGRRILSSVVYSQIEEHKIYGGVVPEIAGRRHCEVISEVTLSAVNKSGLDISQIDAIAVTHSPGLIGALLVGVNFAKGLSYALTRPLIAVHHLRSHIAANYIEYENLAPPFLCLVVSGGHSHIVEVKSYTDYHILGQTRDDAAGEVFDKAARTMGLPYPGGVNLDKAAVGGNDTSFSFPKIKMAGYDFSFSGLKTNVVNIIHNLKQKNEPLPVSDLAASFIKAVTGCLTDKLFAAADKLDYKKIAVAGGVSANSVLRARLKSLCEQTGRELFIPPLSLCGDNAAMVGAQAYYEFLAGNVSPLSLNASASMSID